MPIYPYRCGLHGLFEVQLQMSEHRNPYPCPHCGVEAPQSFWGVRIFTSVDHVDSYDMTNAVGVPHVSNKRELKQIMDSLHLRHQEPETHQKWMEELNQEQELRREVEGRGQTWAAYQQEQRQAEADKLDALMRQHNVKIEPTTQAEFDRAAVNSEPMLPLADIPLSESDARGQVTKWNPVDLTGITSGMAEQAVPL